VTSLLSAPHATPTDGLGARPADESIVRLRELALRSLARMYDPARGLFVFRLRRTPAGVVSEGHSRRYSAISLLGLASEPPARAEEVLRGRSSAELAARLLADIETVDNLGDVALTLWATRALRHANWPRALARLRALRPEVGDQACVELSWALSALCATPEVRNDALGAALARRLVSALDPTSRLFPHVVGDGGARAHVSCFADLVYPIQALSLRAAATGDPEARAAALRCAERLCGLQGPAGQWWWHYDVRTGRVIEPYPVYAIHQDAMGPMALFDCAAATGANFDGAVRAGLRWLFSSPELGGGSLLDAGADLLWRKVCRREPAKLARGLQAAASRLHPQLRVPLLDVLLPPTSIDYEDRPYHLGWLLHAWRPERLAQWPRG
jgi:hypothetical protein